MSYDPMRARAEIAEERVADLERANALAAKSYELMSDRISQLEREREELVEQAQLFCDYIDGYCESLDGEDPAFLHRDRLYILLSRLSPPSEQRKEPEQ